MDSSDHTMRGLISTKVKVRRAFRRRSTAEAKQQSEATRKELDSEDICYGDIITIRKIHSVSIWGNDEDTRENAENHEEPDFEDTTNQFMCTEFGGVVDAGLIMTASTDSDDEKPEPENLRTSLFRILPKLSYMTDKMLVAYDKADKKKAGKSKSTSLMKHHQRHLVIENKETIRQHFGKDVMYGDVVQLQHLATNKFITLKYWDRSFYHPTSTTSRVQLDTCLLDI